MKLTPLENQLIQKHLHGLADTPEAARMKQYIQHGRVSTYDHVISVARLSLLINHRLHLGACDRELVRGAFLHDFFLYDWHKNGYAGRLHGLHHPAAALKNASMRYSLTPCESNIIESHMWPLTLFHIPRCRAAAIVCLADKICSSFEVLARTNSFSC